MTTSAATSPSSMAAAPGGGASALRIPVGLGRQSRRPGVANTAPHTATAWGPPP